MNSCCQKQTLKKDPNAPFGCSLIVLEIYGFLSMELDTLTLCCRQNRLNTEKSFTIFIPKVEQPAAISIEDIFLK